LPRKQSLKASLDFGYWRPEKPLITIVRQEVRDLTTGTLIDPYDL
jgi:hypothetical protein